ncbi:MAG: DNA-directed RNA polymerase subunit beta [Candidatus Buchananbacteria bacterium RIFCSPHIGHO2_02_FULL_45_11b]|uniref:DNA-directed RNA polymerase subunit beta n=4 Tax=Candidatus Buchananiibacteriota TaxID=1817903 RepID=A0A1G1YI26_9BACT|nr:MAG: DNA-directed RNA polymerase subunit beta [Candidatus Buchananbacteria bacterium RIFCSPHIGHO2_01_FULL_46_12]OGY51107.1 MAG: DNA-directed RNA polymerase subunit beta [Candidatus Buchananbacteria bacterium RIFCSPHIGHO2_02_FULL_45_11b]OGY52881.1 MAG: DNA-directed RNA polymerase subunit beta [Candidatus Buchananbacteria bacterium RIFCSPLOWO2_01_FULL_45_31]
MATAKKQPRKVFTEIKEAVPMPDLIEAQKNSYDWFLKQGLVELFEEVSPIKDFIGRDFELSFDKYYLDEPKFDEVTSKEKNLSFEAPLRVNAILVNNKMDKRIEQEIYLGDFPLMTDRGTFVINGIERVVVSQLIRSAGIFFTSEVHGERRYYGAKVIPNRGSWLEFETDANNVIWVKIDRKRKIAATALLRIFGYPTEEEILEIFKDIDTHPEISYIRNTLAKDAAKNEAEGFIEVYKRIRPGDLATVDNAKSLIYAMFFNFERYDFGRVGRYKINQRFSHDLPITKENRVLRVEDLIEVISEIIKLNISQKDQDDIDHLGNRRVRAIGELIQNKFRIGLARMERIIRDRMSTLDINEITPNRLINARPVIGAVKEFFMSSQLSQFMDQTNPLAELEHKRRLSAMGPGGLSRERAGFDVRDVHPTHYGRICPIATPEGPNIGLVGHLACYARINEYGFIETPFCKVKHDILNKAEETENEIARADLAAPGGKEVIVKAGEVISAKAAKALEKISEIKKVPVKPRVTAEVVYLTAFQSENSVTTAATTPTDKNGYFLVERAEVRKYGEPESERVDTIDYMDVAPNQIVSIATSLIPFLEHDDAVRALMGSNMQRQAVPCINPQSPIVGTGLEGKAARDSGHVIINHGDGKVAEVQGDNIKILQNDGQTRSYRLNKFVRSNASTCINQRPIVEKDQTVKRGEVLADGPATDQGELALGQNILVAFMAWEGYNYEDAIIVSEKVVREDRLTSIYIEDFQVEVRDTKLGPEIVTSDIPNIGEEKLKDLDAEGVIRLGASVSSGDILVGKITPKGETELSAEEKLLRAIFGEKARDVRDSSLYLEHGEKGKVVDIKTFSRDAGDKLSSGVIKMYQVSIANLRKIQVGDKMAGRHGNKGVISMVLPVEDMPFLADGTPVDIILSPLGVVSRMNLGQILETHLGIAADKLGYKVKSPVLNGISEDTIKEELKKAGLAESGKAAIYDGRTGDAFEQPVTVGMIYMLKLNHMVEDKIHQRSIGPYSLITQQPLGGKAQFGGQRFGEMEVWALEAYGAANTLQEILTIKSDDVAGRSKAYESIIKGETIKKLNIPESFNVLLRELNGLGLNIDLIKDGKVVAVTGRGEITKEEKVEEKSR